MNTIYTGLTLFGAAALSGIYLLTLVLQNKETPKAIAFVHGGFAATALVLLLVFLSKNNGGPWESALFFGMAALGGFILIYRDITGKGIPKWLAVGHGLLAITGFVLLILFAFQG